MLGSQKFSWRPTFSSAAKRFFESDDFTTYPRAPAWNACARFVLTQDDYLGLGKNAADFPGGVKTIHIGILKSMRTRSGSNIFVFSIASRPSTASPQTSRSLCVMRRDRTPLRTTSWSSTMRTRNQPPSATENPRKAFHYPARLLPARAINGACKTRRQEAQNTQS